MGVSSKHRKLPWAYVMYYPRHSPDTRPRFLQLILDRDHDDLADHTGSFHPRICTTHEFLKFTNLCFKRPSLDALSV